MLTPLKSLKETCWISLEIVPDPPREQPGSLQKNSWKSGREVEKAVLPALSDDWCIDLIWSYHNHHQGVNIIFMHSAPKKRCKMQKALRILSDPMASHSMLFAGPTNPRRPPWSARRSAKRWAQHGNRMRRSDGCGTKVCPGKSAGKLREAEAESLKSFEIFKELLRTRKIGILHDPTNSWEPWTPNNANMCICLPLIGWLLEVQCLPDAFSFLIWIQFKNFKQVIASTSSGFIEAVGLIAIVDHLQFSEGNSPTSCVEPSAALTSKTGAGKEHFQRNRGKGFTPRALCSWLFILFLLRGQWCHEILGCVTKSATHHNKTMHIHTKWCNLTWWNSGESACPKPKHCKTLAHTIIES